MGSLGFLLPAMTAKHQKKRFFFLTRASSVQTSELPSWSVAYETSLPELSLFFWKLRLPQLSVSHINKFFSSHGSPQHHAGPLLSLLSGLFSGSAGPLPAYCSRSGISATAALFSRIWALFSATAAQPSQLTLALLSSSLQLFSSHANLEAAASSPTTHMSSLALRFSYC